MRKDLVTIEKEGLITYREDTAFSPAYIKVRKGTVVTFVNVGQDILWVGSDLHPTHANYPGSHIDKCATQEESKIFDSCQNILPGSLWPFTFDEIGIWGYHNHLVPGHLGTIEVVE